MRILFKCKKCRALLLNYPEVSLLSAHGQQLDLRENSNSAKIDFIVAVSKETKPCSSLDQDVFYINEINLPKWITDCIDKAGWTRGKLMCPGCSARIGSFDFVSGFHCTCQSFVVPPIHLVKSKVDYGPGRSVLASH